MTKFRRKALIVLSGVAMVAGVSALAACGASTNTISFYADGVLVESLSFADAEEGVKAPAVPEKAGYTGTWESYVLGDSDVTVNAVYTPIEYTVSFVAGGEVVGYSTYTVEDSTQVTEPAVPERAEYVGSWEEYTLTTGNLIVGAVYTPKEYTITYIANGVTVDTRKYTAEDSEITAPSVPDQAHYTGEWESYTVTTGNIEVNAIYTPIDYTIKFVNEDGEAVATRTYNIETDEADFEEPEVPEKEGYLGEWDVYSLKALMDMEIEPIYSESLAYTLNEDGESYSVTGIGTFTGSELVIPATYKGLPVTEIASMAFCPDYVGVTTIKKITVGNNVTTIGQAAFGLMPNLETVIFEDSVETIGRQVFYQDYALTSVTIGKNVTTIDSYAFFMTTRLVEVINLSSLNIIAGSSSYGEVAEYALVVTTDTDSKIVVKDGFKFYETEDDVYLIDYIGTEKDLTLPADYNGKTYQIYPHALYKRGLTSVVIPAGVTKIGKYGFYYNTELTNVTIQGETVIGEYAFNSCSMLTSISFDNVKTIEEYAFRETGLTSIVIPDSVETLGQYAFQKCASLQSVTLGAGLKSLGNNLFESCSSLTEVRYNGTVEQWVAVSCSMNTIGSTIFKQITFYFNGEEFTGELVIPEGVTAISSYAFACFPVTTLSLPVSLTSVANYAFNAVSTITDVFYAGTLEQWAAISFGSSSANPLSVSKSAKLYVGSDKTQIAGELDLSAFETIGAYAFYNMASITGVKFSDNLTSIGSYAFGGCTGLTSIDFPASLTSIGNSAFYGCTGLTSVTFPSALETIGYYAFYGCTGLTSLEIPSSVTSIGESAFESCTYLNSVVINGHLDENGNATTVIDELAFAGCSRLYTVTLGAGVKSWATGDSWQTFYQCYRLAEIVNYTETDITAGASNTAGQYAVAVVTSEADKGTVTTDENGFVFYTAKDGKTYLIDYTGTATSIVLPDNGGNEYTVKSCAFYSRTSFKSITIPVQVTAFGGSAFTSTKLTEVIYQGTLSQWAAISFASSTATPTYIAKSLTIGGVVLSGVLDLTGIEKINNYAFVYLTKLTAVIVNGDVGSYAFYKCTGLQVAVLGADVTKIGANAFSGCTALTTVIFTNTADGWTVPGATEDDEAVEISVTNFATNATNLKTTYVAKEWSYEEPKADDAD